MFNVWVKKINENWQVLLCGMSVAFLAASIGTSQVRNRTPSASLQEPNSRRAGLPAAPNRGANPDESVIQRQLVKVAITTSRPEVTRNHAWGLAADITNVSAQPITLFAREVQLVMEPEATRDSGNVAYASFLPNTECSTGRIADGGEPECKGESTNGSDIKIVLQPGEHYMFFWSGVDLDDKGASRNLRWSWGRLQQTLNFVPSQYSFVVSGKVHGTDSDVYHTFAEAVTVKISLPQLAIFLWAGFGSILGYLLVSLEPAGDIGRIRITTPLGAFIKHSWWEVLKVWGKVARGFLSAFLTGSVLSIVANRLSDTQFPVKVSVNDVWGSITVGFVFFFIGSKVLDRLKTYALTPAPQAPASARPTPGPATPTG